MGSILGAGLTYLNLILAARFLGDEMFGLFALALIQVRIGEAVSTFGLRVGVLNLISIYRSANDHTRVVGTIYGCTLIPAVIGSLLALMLWLLAPWLAEDVFRKPRAEPFIRLMGFVIPIMAVGATLANITRGFGHALYFVATRNVILPFCYTLGLLAITYLQAPPTSITYAFGVPHIISLVAALGSVFLVARPLLRDSWPVVIPMRNIISYTLPIVPVVLLYQIIVGTDVIMLGIMRDANQVGVYTACWQLVVVFELIVVAFNTAAGHIYPPLAHAKRFAELEKAYNQAVRLVTVFSVPTVLIVLLNPADLLALMGQDFTAGESTLRILAVGKVVHAMLGSSAFVLLLCGRQSAETLNAGMTAIANVVLNLALIPRFGIVGAAVATTTSAIMLSFLRVWQLKRSMGLRSLRKFLVRPIVIGCGTAIAASGFFALCDLGTGRGTGMLFIRIAAILFLYGTLFMFFGFNAEERTTILRRLGISRAESRLQQE